VTPKLTHACIITNDVARLRAFYIDVLARQPDEDRPEYAEFRTRGAGLSMYAQPELERYAPGATAGAANRSVMVEFEVGDVDAEYSRLRARGLEFVMPPTTQSWGNRAAYLRDPDGNLVNLYTRVS
jgi:catechol 2,3-dioxygenase-like lactoylglutathione lyase family enzyme